MGLFDQLFGKKEPPQDPRLSAEAKGWFEELMAARGWRVKAWAGAEASLEKENGETRTCNLDNLLQEAACAGVPLQREHIENHLRKLDDAERRHEEMKDLAKVRDALRPRVKPAEMAEAMPMLCSKPFVEGELSAVLSVDWEESASYVTKDTLKHWNIPFDEGMRIGFERLLAVSARTDFEPFTDDPRILAAQTPDGIASSRALVLADLFEECAGPLGVLFAVPCDDVLLAYVVRREDAMAVLPKIFAVAVDAANNRPHPVSTRVFWQRNGSQINHLALQLFQKKDGSLEFDVIAADGTPTFEFMHLLSEGKAGASA